jgi:hypothetical protein
MLAQIATAIMLSLLTSEVPPRDITQLGWMSGCWTQALPDGVIEEHWMKPSGGSMLGMSRTIRGGKTTEFEFLQIREVDGSLAYIAKPSGQSEATFPLESVTERELIFENATHDFPQRVIYRRTATGIAARIEGTMNGQSRGMDFPYSRCK